MNPQLQAMITLLQQMQLDFASVKALLDAQSKSQAPVAKSWNPGVLKQFAQSPIKGVMAMMNKASPKGMARTGRGLGRAAGRFLAGKGIGAKKGMARMGRMAGGAIGGAAGLATAGIAGTIAVMQGIDAVKKFSSSIIDANTSIGQFSASMQIVAAQKELVEIFDSMNQGNLTAQSTQQVVVAHKNLLDASANLRAGWTIVTNKFMELADNALAGLITAFEAATHAVANFVAAAAKTAAKAAPVISSTARAVAPGFMGAVDLARNFTLLVAGVDRIAQNTEKQVERVTGQGLLEDVSRRAEFERNRQTEVFRRIDFGRIQ